MPRPNMTNRYNTELTPVEEIQFSDWVNRQRSTANRDPRNDMFDYDIKGWWKDNKGTDLSAGHLTDQYKKPNHPTFSDESMYHGADGHQGGTWGGDEKSGWTYTPGKTNLQMQTPEELQGYFKEVEPDVKLNMPADAGGAVQ